MRYRADLPADSAIRRILVIKWSAMGDVILATALFEDIARAFPGRELHLNTLPVWQGLFAEDTRFQYILAIDLRDSSQQVTAFHEWLRRVRNQHYDLVIDLQCNDRSRLLLSLLWLSGYRIPYCLGNRQQFPYSIAPAELPKPAHTIDRGRAALWAGNIPATTPRPMLHVSDSHYARASELMTANSLLPDQFAVFLPGCNANGYLKR
ncbi:MAG: glycosyltransferase family 9 protein, partial [Candidatus Competibacteraceae bacterium]|nr:glycosyltransferase family 9 protein [Candidatus Competibacteraceae bacterium]